MIAAVPFPTLPYSVARTELSSLALIEVDGADAREFLHGQLSSDVRSLAVGGGHYTSYNSPKGRMLATLIVWRRSDDHFALILAADLADAIKKRLAMFVLRARVTIGIANRRLRGVLGGDAARALSTAIGAPAAAGFASLQCDGISALHLPDGRHIVDVDDALPAPLAAFPVVDEAAWCWWGIRAGVPVVTAATSDKLIAQSANWELLGGVDFRKGCYPGQEIIARMQYLGRLKERLQAFHAEAAAASLAAGLAVHASGRDEAVGTVVNAAPSPAGGSDLLAVVPIDAAGGEALCVAGIALAPRALPYAVPALENVRVKL